MTKKKRGKVYTYTTRAKTLKTARLIVFNMTLGKRSSAATKSTATGAEASLAYSPSLVTNSVAGTTSSTGSSAAVKGAAPQVTTAAVSGGANSTNATAAIPGHSMVAAATTNNNDAGPQETTSTAAGGGDASTAAGSTATTSSSTGNVTVSDTKTVVQSTGRTTQSTEKTSKSTDNTTTASGNNTTAAHGETTADATAAHENSTETPVEEDSATTSEDTNSTTTEAPLSPKVEQCIWEKRDCKKDDALTSSYASTKKTVAGAEATLATSGKKIFLSTGALRYGIEINMYDYCCSLGMMLFEPKTIDDLKDYYNMASYAVVLLKRGGLIGEAYNLNKTHAAYCRDDAPFPYVWPKGALSGKDHYMVLTEVKSGVPKFSSKKDETKYKSSDGLKNLMSLSGITFFACEDNSTISTSAAASNDTSRATSTTKAAAADSGLKPPTFPSIPKLG